MQPIWLQMTSLQIGCQPFVCKWLLSSILFGYHTTLQPFSSDFFSIIGWQSFCWMYQVASFLLLGINVILCSHLNSNDFSSSWMPVIWLHASDFFPWLMPCCIAAIFKQLLLDASSDFCLMRQVTSAWCIKWLLLDASSDFFPSLWNAGIHATFSSSWMEAICLQVTSFLNFWGSPWLHCSHLQAASFLIGASSDFFPSLWNASIHACSHFYFSSWRQPFVCKWLLSLIFGEAHDCNAAIYKQLLF